ncbi:MAG TPA: hypothetical protein VLA61_15695 [Ideonella sp.]|uniref:hypothetical protein n=1 Tax=Ideonella sp. TaxID=1929293 RepID=UPI002C252ACD|nr:hypothetical protein [Ideonella sp.]HSI49714.1 hypothetical protein [Ideonella sp.]
MDGATDAMGVLDGEKKMCEAWAIGLEHGSVVLPLSVQAGRYYDGVSQLARCWQLGKALGPDLFCEAINHALRAQAFMQKHDAIHDDEPLSSGVDRRLTVTYAARHMHGFPATRSSVGLR